MPGRVPDPAPAEVALRPIQHLEHPLSPVQQLPNGFHCASLPIGADRPYSSLREDRIMPPGVGYPMGKKKKPTKKKKKGKK